MSCHKNHDGEFDGFTTFGTDIRTEYHELSPIFFNDSFHKLEPEMTQSVLIKKVSEMVKTIEIKTNKKN